MTLDDIEKLARDLIAMHEASGQTHRVARALLAVLPLIRAAIELHDYDFCDATMGGGLVARDPALYGKVAALYDAVDQMRREMEAAP